MFILVEPLELKSESLQGPYPGLANKYSIINIKLVLLSLYTTVGPVHEKPPLHKGWHKACNNKNWHPMWGLWLVAEAQHHQWAAGWPASGQLQSCTKSDFFLQKNSSDHTTSTRWPTGWLQQCSTPSQGAQKMSQQCAAPSQGAQKTMLCAWRLCPANIGGHWWWCWSPGPVLSEGSQPWVSEEPYHPCPRSLDTEW